MSKQPTKDKSKLQGFYVPDDDYIDDNYGYIGDEGGGIPAGQYCFHPPKGFGVGRSGNVDCDDWEERRMRKSWRSGWELKF